MRRRGTPPGLTVVNFVLGNILADLIVVWETGKERAVEARGGIREEAQGPPRRRLQFVEGDGPPPDAPELELAISALRPPMKRS